MAADELRHREKGVRSYTETVAGTALLCYGGPIRLEASAITNEEADLSSLYSVLGDIR